MKMKHNGYQVKSEKHPDASQFFYVAFSKRQSTTSPCSAIIHLDINLIDLLRRVTCSSCMVTSYY